MRKTHGLALVLLSTAALAGCGSTSEPTQPSRPASRPEQHPAPKAATAITRALQLNTAYRIRIQRNVARTGAPIDDDGWCRQRKLKFGPTSDVAAKYGTLIARQLHILCPHYFIAP